MKPDRLARITVDPKQCGGRPCVRGYRIRVTDILELSHPERPARRFWRIILFWNLRISTLFWNTRPTRPTTLWSGLREISGR